MDLELIEEIDGLDDEDNEYGVGGDRVQMFMLENVHYLLRIKCLLR